MTVFQERLRECRNKTGLSQLNMAAKLGIVFRSYRRYENGDTEPTLSTLVHLADYFDVSIDYLAGRTDEP